MAGFGFIKLKIIKWKIKTRTQKLPEQKQQKEAKPLLKELLQVKSLLVVAKMMPAEFAAVATKQETN
ncbi:MAG: hypothetical protein COV02_02675 [Candidatus Terrybacteria bacterium CG10_big_fil_rev_8_21_14_0_10_41_10]|uniref:Uncharacterized protein n=1 Tax=Candidatus Terrybacteria bacterium CG10_big_fil_rev_8_21_14_0_10_41_10 TaxID=1975026 RepID=A0A2M8LA15_9BACT|nr:MAG: hypothetical protein COV02_02675 [Candidatus Terrybacteria bacterium CG10_big_fil_rev_8_21_14_0_10_41_10]